MKKILIVEDDIFYRKQMVRAISEAFSDILIKTASTMKELFHLLEEEAFDLIIADLVLPDSEGEYVEKLAKEGEAVIVITGYGDLDFKEKIYQLDIVDYIIKADNDRFEYLLKLLQRLEKNVGRTVLVAEDLRGTEHRLKSLLKRQNLNVIEAADGNEALKLIEEVDVDLIVSDYTMPSMDGLELLKMLRQKYSMFDLPFIAISSNDENDTVAKFLKLGANDYLKKPFGKEELLCRINNNLDMLDMLDKIRRHAISDALTGLYNRHYLYETAPKILATAKRYPNQPLSLAIFDIDHFKSFNDRYGHLVGDKILKSIASILKRSVRMSDIVVRFGGEEFLVLMPNTGVKQAYIVAEKLRSIIEKTPIEAKRQQELYITISGGVVEFQPDMSLDELIKCADKALYLAKSNGRNRVQLANTDK